MTERPETARALAESPSVMMSVHWYPFLPPASFASSSLEMPVSLCFFAPSVFLRSYARRDYERGFRNCAGSQQDVAPVCVTTQVWVDSSGMGGEREIVETRACASQAPSWIRCAIASGSVSSSHSGWNLDHGASTTKLGKVEIRPYSACSVRIKESTRARRS